MTATPTPIRRVNMGATSCHWSLSGSYLHRRTNTNQFVYLIFSRVYFPVFFYQPVGLVTVASRTRAFTQGFTRTQWFLLELETELCCRDSSVFSVSVVCYTESVHGHSDRLGMFLFHIVSLWFAWLILTICHCSLSASFVD